MGRTDGEGGWLTTRASVRYFVTALRTVVVVAYIEV
ncbi:hypothetical protein M2161_009271 [Streptomyces sp. SAI-133]|nr:hypothetical protein [Streptomyces sp. SAI-133]